MCTRVRTLILTILIMLCLVLLFFVHDFKDVFTEDISSGLPSLKEIEHPIDLVPKAMIPNRPSSYKSNPEETKEL